jgi:hypothetical protein
MYEISFPVLKYSNKLIKRPYALTDTDLDYITLSVDLLLEEINLNRVRRYLVHFSFYQTISTARLNKRVKLKRSPFNYQKNK